MMDILKKNAIGAIKTAFWFVLLSFPIIGIYIDQENLIVNLKIFNLIIIFLLVFVSYLFIKIFKQSNILSYASHFKNLDQYEKKIYIIVGIIVLLMPFISSHQVVILSIALLYIISALGLNIVVGMAGLLDLGYIAFYAIGAYTYALLNHYYQINFWIALPIGGILAVMGGIILGFPVLRLRGDYLAIVTLGFGEIIRIVIENWETVTNGPMGISDIDSPILFGYKLGYIENQSFMYYMLLILFVITIVITERLKNSRMGRAWIAIREDQDVAKMMGINTTIAKLSAFALGALWSGLAGVMQAAKNSYINGINFTFIESATLLCIVVFGGLGSVKGVILSGLILVLLPEYLRVFADYRLLIFGMLMIIMMLFKPDGLISKNEIKYKLPDQIT